MSSEPEPRCAARKGNLIVVSAPSGAGKSSLVKKVLARMEQLRYSVSWTTRQARDTERDAADYHFVSADRFASMRDTGGFLEWAEVHGHLYGTPKLPIDELLNNGCDVILDVDVQGAGQIRRRMPEAVTVFVLPPTQDVLESRLRSRDQDSREEIERRLRNAVSEVRQSEAFDYVIVNDDLERASSALEAIIIAERHRLKRQGEVIRAIMETFGGESLHG